jgi:hypothetical protein
MNGSYAVFNNELYFSDALMKPNMTLCQFPMEHWLQAPTPMTLSKTMYVPLEAASIGAMEIYCNYVNEPVHPSHGLPAVCGLVVTHELRLLELSIDSESRKFVMRQVPYGKGVVYVRGCFEYQENVLTGALRLKNNLRDAVELAAQSIVNVNTNPIFTTVQVASYAVAKHDLSLIRTLTDQDVRAVVKEQVEKAAKAQGLKNPHKV